MSISTFTGIQTSLRGLLAQQRALDVTSHNIANASTVGYTRQSAELVATAPLPVPTASGAAAGALGTGVDVQTYKRVRDQFLDLQYRAQNMSLGEQTARSDALQNVELSFAEPGDTGIATALDKFWASWGDLSNSADSGPARQAVIDARTPSTSRARTAAPWRRMHSSRRRAETIWAWRWSSTSAPMTVVVADGVTTGRSAWTARGRGRARARRRW